MRHSLIGTVILSLGMIWVTGCFWQKPVVVDEVYAKKGIRLIAVMPIKGKAADENMVRLMRGKILEALYFKGYPKIPLELIDEKLAKTYDKSAGRSADISPQAVKSLLNVDAALYVDLKECKTSTTFLYASASVSATFELRSANTGETVWKNQYQGVDRCFDVTPQRLEFSVYQVLEPVIQEVVDKTLKTLPEGPEGIKQESPDTIK
jgi:hypothetical protein